MQRVVARFCKRNDAEENLCILKRLNPAIAYDIVFDSPASPVHPHLNRFNLLQMRILEMFLQGHQLHQTSI